MPAYIDPSPIITVGGGVLATVLALLGGGFGLVLVFVRRVRLALVRHWGKALVLALALVGATVMAWNLIPAHEPETTVNPPPETNDGRRIILLGLDGLSPEIVEPMLAAGELPHLQRLQQMGGYARLRTTNPAQSPVAWSTIATGLNPGAHGVFDFIRRDPETCLPEVGITRMVDGQTLSVRRGRAFWDYATDHDTPSVILRCPVTFPPDAIRGRMLAGMGVPDLLGTQGTFSFYTTAAVDRDRDVGGEVHHVERAASMKLELYGPNRKTLWGGTERMTIPFVVTPSAEGAGVELAEHELDLAVGQWSAWLPVTFKAGLSTTVHGMVRLLLVQAEPEFELYVSPVSLDPRRPHVPISHPPAYAAELADDLGLYATRGMPFDTWALNEGRITTEHFRVHADELLAENTRLMKHELARCNRGVFFAYFEYPDIMQHMHWRGRDPQHPLHEPFEDGDDAIAAAYRRMDEVVGHVLAQASDDDVILAFSDHGFTSFRRAAHINSWLREHGYLVLSEGTVGQEFLRNVDWSQTKAYALGFGAVYLNLAGREFAGIVQPADADALKRKLADELGQWQDNQAAVVSRVYDGREIFRGAHTENAPDLYVGFHKGYRASWQTALGAAPEPLIEDNTKQWSGTHLVDPALVPGVLFSSRRPTRADPSLYDIAPTVLKLIGLTDDELDAANLDGRPLF